ncbi:MAG: sigma 54-interacting transcriptional regulator, partial [Blastocatellia bacterium]|nr:sigma 54-interacting transcriptional regulator [Blastocatellia bacterium]
VVPLLIEGTLIGCLASSNSHQHITWDSVLLSRFQQLGNIFGIVLARRRDGERLQSACTQISELKELLEREKHYLRDEIELEHNHSAVIGQSTAIRSVLKKAELVAATDSVVLISGETGVGKEMIARTIHELSKRKDKPMVKVNCAAMPATLIESELFGRERGAYTGALSREIGRFELANGSTIFLDEIGELPIELQAKFLRVLQDGEFERLGSSRTLRVDARVIAATNRDLRAAVKDGKFREDLFYRLSVFPIDIPPLRERREDILALAWHLLRDLCKRMGRDVESVEPATLRTFHSYSWPGNVRELRNVIERYLILNPGPVFRAEVPESGDAASLVGQNLDEVERQHMQLVLQKTRWRIRGKGGAAELLGLKPTTLEARMKKLGIVRPQ